MSQGSPNLQNDPTPLPGSTDTESSKANSQDAKDLPNKKTTSKTRQNQPNEAMVFQNTQDLQREKMLLRDTREMQEEEAIRQNRQDSQVPGQIAQDTGEKNVYETDPERISDVRTAEIKPQVQDAWSQNWRYMLRTYPVMNQFKDEYQVLCVRIEIKDVRLLPEKYWSMINNSFLLHGFFNYRYLVFGRIGQHWFIGVPGIYQNQEHVMASIFGFPDFLPQKQKNEQGEQPGYWYRTLEAV